MSLLQNGYEPPKTFEGAQREMEYRPDRPFYESDTDRHNEDLFKEHFETTYPNLLLHKLPIKYTYDFGVYRRDKKTLHSLIEYKHRSYDFKTIEQWGGLKFALEKWVSMIDWQRRTNVRCCLFVHMENSPPNSFYQIDVDQQSMEGKEILWWDHRKRRNDKLDAEPCILIPCQNFKLVNFNTI